MRSAWLTVMAAGLLAGCGGSGPEGETLRVTVVGEDGGPGPYGRRLIAEATSATLVGRDGTGQAVAGLASSWRFLDDGSSLILRLRPVRWADGKPLESKQVVASFRAAQRRGEDALGFAGLGAGSAVRAPISRVVELRMAGASPLALGWLAEPGLAIGRDGIAFPGPYRAGRDGDTLTLDRRSQAPEADSRAARITLKFNADSGAAVAALGDDATDLVIGEGLAGLGEARAGAPAPLLRVEPLWGVYGYLMNTARGPLADGRVRLALALAVDRAAVAARFGLPQIRPLDTLVPGISGVAADDGGALPGASPAGPGVAAGSPPDWRGYDSGLRRAEALRLLGEAGFGPEKPLRLVLLLPPGLEHRQVAEEVAAAWEPLGVDLAVAVAEAETRARRIKADNFDLAVVDASLAVPDAAALLARWRCGKGLACNPAADAALAAALAGPANERPLRLAEAERLWMAAPPMVPILQPVRWAVVARGLDGWTGNIGSSHPLGRLGREPRR